MKRLAVLLALVMTVGLVGCGNSGTQSKTESKSDTKEEATTEKHLKESILSMQIM